MTSRTERFERKSAPQGPKPTRQDTKLILRFAPEEEAALLAESSSYKARANDLFKEKNYEDAIAGYNEALEVCPKYLSYDRAVIKSNIAACHLHTSAWKDAITASSEALDLLDPKPETKEESEKGGNDGEQLDDNEEVEEKWEDAKEEPEEEADEEIISAGAAKAEPIPDMKKQRENDEDRIRVKALMRRAKARTELGGWSTLQAAEEDYKRLEGMPNISFADRKFVRQQLVILAPKTKAAQEKEMAEMMGKLKQLGNGILKPFGLSTENFQMVKDEQTGGYSMNFNQGGSK